MTSTIWELTRWSAAVAFAVGCSSMSLTPRLQDSQAPRDYLAEAKPSKQSCDPPVELVRSPTDAQRPYREIASLSATCYPGAPTLCEQRLLQRACEHQADALILTESEPGGSPPGASGQSQISISGRAVRWTAP
jgi:hypothetical protein